MNDFKLNAAKIIAAQKQRVNGSRSPESDSNWDSSDPEDTLPNVSSPDEKEEVSTASHRSRGKRTPHQPLKAQDATTRHRVPVHKPQPSSSNRLGVGGEQPAIKSSPASSLRSGKAFKSGINVFADRGDIDLSDEDVSVTGNRSVTGKEEKPPYDFRGALVVDDTRRADERPHDRPGKSRKGMTYDLTSDRHSQASNSDEKQLIVMTPDGEKKRNNWKVNLGFTSDDVQSRGSSNNNVDSRLSRKDAPTTSDVDLSKIKATTGKEDQNDAERYEGRRLDESTQLLAEERMHRYVYEYNHGNVRYYDTREGREDVYMTAVANKSEKLVRRGVREFFGALRILADFILIFILELLRFVVYNILGLFITGLLTTLGDYLLKPILTAVFNSLVQPVAVFSYNVALAFRTVTRPVIDVITAFFRPLAMLLRAIRLVEVNQISGQRSGQEWRRVEDV